MATLIYYLIGVFPVTEIGTLNIIRMAYNEKRDIVALQNISNHSLLVDYGELGTIEVNEYDFRYENYGNVYKKGSL